jgi:thiamine biosynthesis protein ThiS
VAQWLCRDEPRGVAVALNGGVVRQSEWHTVQVRDGDELEIVEVVIGG